MSNSIAVLSEHQKLETQALSWPDRAREITITNSEQYQEAASLLTEGIKPLRREIDEHHDPLIASAHAHHKLLIGAKKKLEQPLDEAERIIKRTIGAYRDEQEQIRREEERRRQAEALRLEEERQLLDAIDAEQSGDAELADQIMTEPLFAPVVTVATSLPKVAGVSFRETWHGECSDLMALVRHVATHPEHIHFMQANTVAINQQARASRDALKVPGLRFYASEGVAAGRR